MHPCVLLEHNKGLHICFSEWCMHTARHQQNVAGALVARRAVRKGALMSGFEMTGMTLTDLLSST